MTLLHELSKIDRRAALLFNREIRLLKKRGKLEFDFSSNTSRIPKDLSGLIDSFSWSKTRQGYVFWEKVLEKSEGGR